MSILVRFSPTGNSATPERYDETVRRLRESHGFPPAGLEYHVAFRDSAGDLRVSEIWDSREQFEKFGQRLMPVLTEMGIQLSGEPEVLEIHNIIKR